MQHNKYFAIAALILFGLVNVVYGIASFRHGLPILRRGLRPRPVLPIALALCSVMIMLAMGWARETARAANGYLIYGTSAWPMSSPPTKL